MDMEGRPRPGIVACPGRVCSSAGKNCGRVADETVTNPVLPARYRMRKAIGRTLFLLGLVCLGFFYPVPFFLTAFVCPVVALALGVTAVGRFGRWAGSANAAQFMDAAAFALLYSEIPNAVLVLLLCVDKVRGGDLMVHGLAAWLWVAVLLIPQLFWSSRLRANRWVALGVALVTLAAGAEFWYELRTAKW